jgi:hypothetical protein
MRRPLAILVRRLFVVFIALMLWSGKDLSDRGGLLAREATSEYLLIPVDVELHSSPMNAKSRLETYRLMLKTRPTKPGSFFYKDYQFDVTPLASTGQDLWKGQMSISMRQEGQMVVVGTFEVQGEIRERLKDALLRSDAIVAVEHLGLKGVHRFLVGHVSEEPVVATLN